jgi:hypothetical protein
MPRKLISRVAQTVREVLCWGGWLEFDSPSRGGRCYRQGRFQSFVRGDTSCSTGIKKIGCCRLIGLARNRFHQVGGFEKFGVGAIEGLKKIRVVDSLCPVARERRSGPWDWRDQSRGFCCPRLDLGFSRSRGRKAATTSCPSDLPDGERETFSHGRGSWNDDES